MHEGKEHAAKAPGAEQQVSVVAGEIQRYLAAHPHARDTLEGVARWWLTRQRYHEAVQTVHHALEHLVARGCVERVVSANGIPLYALSRARRSPYPARNPVAAGNGLRSVEDDASPGGPAE